MAFCAGPTGSMRHNSRSLPRRDRWRLAVSRKPSGQAQEYVMKRILSFLSLAFVLGVAGCNGGSDSGNSSSTGGTSKGGDTGKKLVVGIVFDSGGRGDKSFNDSAWAGVERAKSEYGVEEKAVESKSEKDYEPNLTGLADENCDIIFAVGINMKSALEKVAPNYPNIKFAIVDASVTGS